MLYYSYDFYPDCIAILFVPPPVLAAIITGIAGGLAAQPAVEQVMHDMSDVTLEKVPACPLCFRPSPRQLTPRRVLRLLPVPGSLDGCHRRHLRPSGRLPVTYLSGFVARAPRR